MLQEKFNFRNILILDVQTGSESWSGQLLKTGSDHVLKTGSGSDHNTQVRNPDFYPFLSLTFYVQNVQEVLTNFHRILTIWIRQDFLDIQYHLTFFKDVIEGLELSKQHLRFLMCHYVSEWVNLEIKLNLLWYSPRSVESSKLTCAHTNTYFNCSRNFVRQIYGKKNY